MALRDLLTLTTVQVSRETVTPDGMAGQTITTSVTTLAHSIIWMAGSGNRWMSDRMIRASTHVLACEPAEYSWTQDDRQVIYGDITYKIVGRPDNIMGKDELEIVPLEQQT